MTTLAGKFELARFARDFFAEVLLAPESIERLTHYADDLARNAGATGYIQAFRSGVYPRDLTSYMPDAIAIALDFGGTKVKAVAVGTTGEGRELVPISGSVADLHKIAR